MNNPPVPFWLLYFRGDLMKHLNCVGAGWVHYHIRYVDGRNLCSWRNCWLWSDHKLQQSKVSLLYLERCALSMWWFLSNDYPYQWTTYAVLHSLCTMVYCVDMYVCSWSFFLFYKWACSIVFQHSFRISHMPQRAVCFGKK